MASKLTHAEPRLISLTPMHAFLQRMKLFRSLPDVYEMVGLQVELCLIKVYALKNTVVLEFDDVSAGNVQTDPHIVEPPLNAQVSHCILPCAR
jgi:hypothetical protein